MTGLMLMRGYFAERGEGDQRDTIITADTAHGTIGERDHGRLQTG